MQVHSLSRYMRDARKRYWLADILVSVIVVTIALMFYEGFQDMHSVFHTGDLETISLQWKNLPYDSLRTDIRLIIGLFFSLIFALVAGVLAAKNKHAARVILPFINFMESIPLVGFITLSVAIGSYLYPGSVMGIEFAAIFGVFTGQAWNMALTLYQSMKITPPDLLDMADNFQVSAWQRFWKIELPYAIPGLLWNTIVSQAAAWFAIVGSEAFSVNNQTANLPGIGSYLNQAIGSQSYKAVLVAIFVMIINIILIDQLLFRPLVKWSDKFKYSNVQGMVSKHSWWSALLQDAQCLQTVCRVITQQFKLLFHVVSASVNTLVRWRCLPTIKRMLKHPAISKSTLIIWYGLLAFCIVHYGYRLIIYMPHFDLVHMGSLMLLTTLRVAAAMILSLIFFVPVGIWIGSCEKRTRRYQPFIQVMASLPPNILYPLMAMALIAMHQSLGWWTIPLIMLGTQWYVLFNVIAGVNSLPQDIIDMQTNFNIKGFFGWRKIIIPAIFPYIVTGIISAAGGAWNADITAEVINWGKTTLSTEGLGAFISSTAGVNSHFAMTQQALGCTLMSLLVAFCIIFIWRPLYRLAETRFYVR